MVPFFYYFSRGADVVLDGMSRAWAWTWAGVFFVYSTDHPSSEMLSYVDIAGDGLDCAVTSSDMVRVMAPQAHGRGRRAALVDRQGPLATGRRSEARVGAHGREG